MFWVVWTLFENLIKRKREDRYKEYIVELESVYYDYKHGKLISRRKEVQDQLNRRLKKRDAWEIWTKELEIIERLQINIFIIDEHLKHLEEWWQIGEKCSFDFIGSTRESDLDENILNVQKDSSLRTLRKCAVDLWDKVKMKSKEGSWKSQGKELRELKDSYNTIILMIKMKSWKNIDDISEKTTKYVMSILGNGVILKELEEDCNFNFLGCVWKSVLYKVIVNEYKDYSLEWLRDEAIILWNKIKSKSNEIPWKKKEKELEELINAYNSIILMIKIEKWKKLDGMFDKAVEYINGKRRGGG